MIRTNQNRGFTLIEAPVGAAIVIIAMMGAIQMMSANSKFISTMRRKADNANVLDLRVAQLQACVSSNGGIASVLRTGIAQSTDLNPSFPATNLSSTQVNQLLCFCSVVPAASCMTQPVDQFSINGKTYQVNYSGVLSLSDSTQPVQLNNIRDLQVVASATIVDGSGVVGQQFASTQAVFAQ